MLLSLAFAAFSRHTTASAFPRGRVGSRMPDLGLKAVAPKTESVFRGQPRERAPEDPKQRNLMVGSLCLLLLALAIVLWHDRDFWFPDTVEEADQSVESQPVRRTPIADIPHSPLIASKPPETAKSKRWASKQKSARSATTRAVAKPDEVIPAPQSPASPVTVTSRTVLPPLEIEVVAGDKHHTVRNSGSSVRVDLQPGTPAEPVADPSSSGGPGVSGDSQNAADITNEASERVHMSADTFAIVAKPVRPNYPMLARQTKVQGSVILQAMIGRDGIIQNLHLVSGPHILASAAEDAVRQWHFKPHFEGSEPVETQAKITVNFTISTN